MRETCEFASAVAAEQFDVPLVDVGIHLDAGTDAGPLRRSPRPRSTSSARTRCAATGRC